VLSIVVISKDEPALDETLAALHTQAAALTEEAEIIVVDASAGRMDDVRVRHPQVRWLEYEPPRGVRISIPHQRNHGVAAAAGDGIVFIDAGCRPAPNWLARLASAIREDGECVAAGLVVAPEDTHTHYQLEIERVRSSEYLQEAPTLNLAFTRTAFEVVGGFDERFEYGSDIDFTWRLTDHGFRIRSVPEAVVEHDWGSPRRQLRRAYQYGRARARLYQKHAARRARIWRDDPVVIAYPLFLLGLPVTVIVPAYPLLLLIPLWRARRHGAASVLADHLAYGIGVLSVIGSR
jgi:GT2 family glycosyltransferase